MRIRWRIAAACALFPFLGLSACGGNTVAPNAPLRSVVLNVRGHDLGQTPKFTVPDTWGIAWSYRGCTKINGVPYLQAAIYLPSNDIVRITIRDFGGPSHHGKIREHGSGTYYLGVSSTCPWRIRILTPPP